MLTSNAEEASWYKLEQHANSASTSTIIFAHQSDIQFHSPAGNCVADYHSFCQCRSYDIGAKRGDETQLSSSANESLNRPDKKTTG